MSALLEVKDLELCYGDAQVLVGVSLRDSAKAESSPSSAPMARVNPRLIRAIAGIERPRAGKIFFAGRDITGLDSHEICDLGIGQVAEGRQLVPDSDHDGKSGDGRDAAARPRQYETDSEEVFELFPRLGERRKQLAGTLSGGEQQMLAIGRCLMGRPELIMFDEPSLGLAPTIVQQCCTRFAR